jgi:hypothetical protein
VWRWCRLWRCQDGFVCSFCLIPHFSTLPCYSTWTTTSASTHPLMRP